jgi:hypothetical protein
VQKETGKSRRGRERQKQMIVVVGLVLCVALFVVSLMSQPKASLARPRRKKD